MASLYQGNRHHKKFINNYKTKKEKKEIQLEKDIDKFRLRYCKLLQWVWERTPQDRKILSQIREEIKYCESNDGDDFNNFIRKLINIGFKLKCLRKIIFTFRHTNSLLGDRFLFTNLIKTPYNFITIEYQLISFEKAEIINKEYRLNTSIDIRIKAWIYDLYLKGGRLGKTWDGRWKRNKKNAAFYIKKKEVKEQYLYYLLKNKIIKNQYQFTTAWLDKLKRIVIRHKHNKEYYTTEEFERLEKKLGNDLITLYYDREVDESVDNFDHKKINSFIKEEEEEQNIKLTPKQKEAIVKGITKKFSIITGYPGSGKTTVVKFIIKYKQRYFKSDNICLMGPTGLSVKNLKDNCKNIKLNKHLIGTNHKMIFDTFIKIRRKHDNELTSFEREKYRDLPKIIDIMIIDEASMIDIFMFRRIMRWVDHNNGGFNCSFMLVGDINQLPPINYGTPFASIIESEIFDDNITELDEIKRNSGNLSKNIIKLNNERLEIKDFDNKTMQFIAETDFSDSQLAKHFARIKRENDSRKKIHFVASQKKKKWRH